MHLVILSPDKIILDVNNVKKVKVRLSDGSLLSIFKGHAPLIAELKTGKLEYIQFSEKIEILISDGIIHIKKDHITIYVGNPMTISDEFDNEASHTYDNLTRTLMANLKFDDDLEAD